MSQPSVLDKSVSDLSVDDLLSLKDLAEGWYCEYKREIPSPASAAKSLSSFANTYGGWLFYGAKASKSTRCVEELNGIAAMEIPQAEMWLRQAVSAHMTPAAYFDHKVLFGPLPQLGLPSERAVIAIHVPMSVNAPHVHRSGKIYRRVADESDPQPETDRHYLDLLWDRSKTIKAELKEIITEEPPRQNLTSRYPILRLLIFHDVWRSRQTPCAVVGDGFYQLMMNGALVFDNVYPTSSGFIARQAARNDPLGPTFSWHHRPGCIDEITVPFNSYDLEDKVRVLDLRPYEHATEYIARCRKAGAGQARLIDLSIMYSLLLSIFVRLNDVLVKDKPQTEVAYKLQIGGMSGCVPFLDVADFLEAVKAYGIPVIQDPVFYAPPGVTPDSLEPLVNITKPRSDAEKDGSYCAIINCISVFFTLCRGMGVDLRATGFDGTENGVVAWHEKLTTAAERFYGVSDLVRKRKERTP